MENIYRLPYPVNSFSEHFNSGVKVSHKQVLLKYKRIPETLGFETKV
jgi:hypothetical protein